MENNPISLKSLSTNVNSMKIENLSLNDLTLMVGANGSGKTVLMTMFWCLNTIANLFFMMKNKNACMKTFQYILDNSYTHQDFTGDINGDFGDFKLNCTLKEGKIEDFDIILNDPNFTTTNLSIPNYMSSSTRLYSSVIQYINFRDALGITETVQLENEKIMSKLLKTYKLYDILFLEKSLIRLSDPFFELRAKVRSSIKEFIGKDISNIFYDKDKLDIFYTEIISGEKKTRSISYLSAGEQAVLNMLSQY